MVFSFMLGLEKLRFLEHFLGRCPMVQIIRPEDTPLANTASHEGQAVEMISISNLNILEQPRDRFDGIGELAESIAANGLLSPISVARNNPRLTGEYARLVNRIWRRPEGSAFSLANLHPIRRQKPKSYLILIAGECRTRAFLSLGRTEIPAFIYDDLDPQRILKIQLTENIRKRRPPLPREAQAIVGLFNLERMTNGHLSKKGFCGEVGISPEQLLVYQRIFMDVPDRIRDAFERGLISLGIAREFWSLWNESREKEQCLAAFGGLTGFEEWLSGEMLDRIMDDTLTVVRARELMRKQFRDKIDLQQVFDLAVVRCDNFLENQLRQWGSDTTAIFNRLKVVLNIFAEGRYPALCSPFTDQSYRKLFGQIIALLEQTESHLDMLTAQQRHQLLVLVQGIGEKLSRVELLQQAITLCRQAEDE